MAMLHNVIRASMLMAVDDRPRKFNNFIGSAIHADAADNRQDHIFGINAFRQGSGDAYFYGLGIVKSADAFKNADFQIGGSHASGEGAKSTMGAGVRIPHNDGMPRPHKAFFREKRMADAVSADIKKIPDLMPTGPVTKNLALKRGLGIFGRRHMIDDDFELWKGQTPGPFPGRSDH